MTDNETANLQALLRRRLTHALLVLDLIDAEHDGALRKALLVSLDIDAGDINRLADNLRTRGQG